MATKKTMREELCTDLLLQIVRKLSYSDAVRFSAVRTSWREAAKISGVFSRPILLTIPGNQTSVSNVYGSNRLSLRVRSLSEGNVSNDVANVVVSLTKRYIDSHCIGSSKGMLVFQHKKRQTGTVLIDPFSGKSFRIPPLAGLDFVKCVCQKQEFKVLKSKAVILDDQRSLVLVVMCTCSKGSINYCRDGLWANLDKNRLYRDMVARERRLFVMWYWGFVDVWDFNNSNSDRPLRVMHFRQSNELARPVYRHRERRYLVESMGEFLLVRRFIVWKRTVRFQVYKSRFRKGENWEEVERLRDDTALFLGANESVSVSIEDLPEGCVGNSIYFTNDHFTGKITDVFDMGIYSLEQKKITAFHALDHDHGVDQPAIWMIKIFQS